MRCQPYQPMRVGPWLQLLLILHNLHVGHICKNRFLLSFTFTLQLASWVCNLYCLAWCHFLEFQSCDVLFWVCIFQSLVIIMHLLLSLSINMYGTLMYHFWFLIFHCLLFLYLDSSGWKGFYFGKYTNRPEGKGFHIVCITYRWEGIWSYFGRKRAILIYEKAVRTILYFFLSS